MIAFFIVALCFLVLFAWLFEKSLKVFRSLKFNTGCQLVGFEHGRGVGSREMVNGPPSLTRCCCRYNSRLLSSIAALSDTPSNSSNGSADRGLGPEFVIPLLWARFFLFWADARHSF
jgi:hypothetical protein